MHYRQKPSQARGVLKHTRLASRKKVHGKRVCLTFVCFIFMIKHMVFKHARLREPAFFDFLMMIKRVCLSVYV